MPISEEDDSLSDIEPDVPEVFPVRKKTAAVESLCFPVVVPTRPQGGCDPILPLSKGRGRNGQEAIVSGRVSKVVDLDVSRGIFLEPDLLPVVEMLAVPVVAVTRSRLERPLLVAQPVDITLSRRESNVEMLDAEWCGEPEFLPAVMPTDNVEPLFFSVADQTSPQVGQARPYPC